MSDDQVDMEWAWPPIQARTNLARFAALRLDGRSEHDAYQSVLLHIANRFLKAAHEIETVYRIGHSLITANRGRNFHYSGWCFKEGGKGFLNYWAEYDYKTGLLSHFGCEVSWRATNDRIDVFRMKAIPI